MFKERKALLISPHQDDFEIGCCGLVRKLLKNGSNVVIAYGTLIDSEYRKYNKKAGQYRIYTGFDRLQEMKKAMDIVSDNAGDGILRVVEPLAESELHHKLDTLGVGKLSSRIEALVRDNDVDMILVSARSFNQDHEALNRAVMTVGRAHFYNRDIMEYEVGGETDFIPNFYLQLSENEAQLKLDAFACYETQQSGDLHLVSVPGIKNRMEQRGRECHSRYAEAYRVVRMVAS